MSNDAFTDLETRLAFQEDVIDKLSLTVSRQQNEIDILKEALQLLNKRLANLTPGDDGNPADERPPHY